MKKNDWKVTIIFRDLPPDAEPATIEDLLGAIFGSASGEIKFEFVAIEKIK
jgi:hypothetical protein